jgi:transcriptional regulator with XRE-family HTH domain
MDEAARRQELKEFLRDRREALQPEAVGLVAGPRRRTPGLRREEVALAAGVGVTWYTWLEQGRDIVASRDALRRIARALRMTPSDESYLLCLGGVEERSAGPLLEFRVEPPVQALLDGLQRIPALVYTRSFDVVAYNRLADKLFELGDGQGRFALNQIWRLFMDPKRRALHVDWEEMAARTVGVARARHGRYPDDAELAFLISTLRRESTDFNRLWKEKRTAPMDDIVVRLRHPRFGRLDANLVRFMFHTEPNATVSAFTPADRRTALAFAKLARRR